MPAPVNNDKEGLKREIEPRANTEQTADIAALENDPPLAESEERYRALFNAVDVGFCIIEMIFDAHENPWDYLFLETNAAFEQHTGLFNSTGKTIRELVPGISESWFRLYGNVALTGESARFENHDPALSRWFDVYALRVGPPEKRQVGILFTDITARKEAQEARHEADVQLRKAQNQLEAALAAGNIGTWTLDVASNRVVADYNLAHLFALPPDKAVGEDLSIFVEAMHPEDRDRVIAAIGEAVRQSDTYESEYRIPQPNGTDRWVVARGKVEREPDGTSRSLSGVVVDITEQKQAGSRERARLTEIFMQAPAFMAALRGPEHIFDLANPPYYRLIGHRDIIGKTLTSALPEVVEQGFLELLDQVYRTGEPFIGKDVPIMLQMEPNAPLVERFLDFTYQPLFDTEGSVSGILAHGIDLTDRKQLEREREALLIETRMRAERESLLNQIGAAVRAAADPEAILQAAVALLGQGLQADRCYFARYNQTRDSGTISPEWLREGSGLDPIAGVTRRMSSFSVNRDSAFKVGNTQVVNDTIAFAPDNASPLLALNLRALIRVPIEIGNQMTALAVAMAHEPRQWSEADVQLAENVAALVRSALETAFTQQRERNIAEHLQAALQPPAPKNLPGLLLASYYRPALDEASVGGDFYDVLPIEKNCNALVVADLSGKGLAAAEQVATVRNMLRFALYNSPSVSDAVTRLHVTLVENDLLSGFATLFVGMYDAAELTLTYVNCGQEPGLLWRAKTREVIRLEPTGPVLGGFGPGGFTQEVVPLAIGDVIMLFTDGLTDIGPSRKDLLNVSGVGEMLRRFVEGPEGELNPNALVSHMVAEIEAIGRDSIRDDIAFLAGVVNLSSG